MADLKTSSVKGFFVLAAMSFATVIVLIPAVDWAFVKFLGKTPADVLTFGKKAA